jgi:hypothetical protein
MLLADRPTTSRWAPLHGANASIRSGRSSKARTEADTSSERHPSRGVRSQWSQTSVQPSSLTRAVARADSAIQHRDRNATYGVARSRPAETTANRNGAATPRRHRRVARVVRKRQRCERARTVAGLLLIRGSRSLTIPSRRRVRVLLLGELRVRAIEVGPTPASITLAPLFLPRRRAAIDVMPGAGSAGAVSCAYRTNRSAGRGGARRSRTRLSQPRGGEARGRSRGSCAAPAAGAGVTVVGCDARRFDAEVPSVRTDLDGGRSRRRSALPTVSVNRPQPAQAEIDGHASSSGGNCSPEG